MDEFVRNVRAEAKAALRAFFGQEGTPESDPIVELVGFLLEDRAGRNGEEEDSFLTMENWQIWNQLALDRPAELSRLINQLLIRERNMLPKDLPVLRMWAVWLIQSTLDQIEMA